MAFPDRVPDGTGFALTVHQANFAASNGADQIELEDSCCHGPIRGGTDMKLIVLKGGDESLALPPVTHQPTRAAGAVAVSGDGPQWVLLNISPAVALQLATDARLLQHAGLADAGVRSVVLTDAQLDHVTGLLSLRDGAPIHLYATPAVFEELTLTLPVLPMLEHYCGVHWHVIPVAGECRTAVFQVDGLASIEFTAIATDAPLAPHAARRGNPTTGDSIALAMRDLSTGQRYFCASGLTGVGTAAVEWMREADCVVVGAASSAPLADDGLPDLLDPLDLLGHTRARRKLLLRNLEQDWREHSEAAELRTLARFGIELAVDRMEIRL
jgi:pyrroloquinoline quinone biosynthesis protein B